MSTEGEREYELAKSVYRKGEVLRGGEVTQPVDDIFFVIEKCCVNRDTELD